MYSSQIMTLNWKARRLERSWDSCKIEIHHLIWKESLAGYGKALCQIRKDSLMLFLIKENQSNPSNSFNH